MKWKLCILTAFLAGLNTAVVTVYPRIEAVAVGVGIVLLFAWLIGDLLNS